MPNLKIDGFNEVEDILQTLAKDGVGLIKSALYPASHITYEEVQRQIDGFNNMDDIDRRGLKTSLYHSKMFEENGVIYEVIGFTGYNERGAPNIEIARSLEHGHSTKNNSMFIKKRPFMRPALNHTKSQVIHKMQDEITEKVKKLQKG